MIYHLIFSLSLKYPYHNFFLIFLIFFKKTSFKSLSKNSKKPCPKKICPDKIGKFKK